MSESDYGAKEYHRKEAKLDAIRAQDQGLVIALKGVIEEDILFNMLDQWQQRFAVDIIAKVQTTGIDLTPRRRTKIKEIIEKVENDSLLEESLDNEDNMRARGFPE